MQSFHLLGCLMAISLAACANYEQGRPFDVSKANEIKIGKTTKKEVVELLGPPLTSGLTPMAGFAPGMQTMMMAPMEGVPGPLGGARDTEYWSYQHSKRGGLVTSPFTGAGTGTGVSLQITFKNDVVSDCIITNTESTGSVMFAPYYASGQDQGTTHQHRCGESSF
jgi:hypothetical protein